jgi:hypothetical protein
VRLARTFAHEPVRRCHFREIRGQAGERVSPNASRLSNVRGYKSFLIILATEKALKRHLYTPGLIAPVLVDGVGAHFLSLLETDE